MTGRSAIPDASETPAMPSRRPVVTGALVALLGLYFAVAGSWLAAVGGSWYYLISGACMVASGALIIVGRRVGVWLYAAVWLGTVAWALWESGLDFWLLEPKILAPTVLGLWVFAPWVTGKLEGSAPRPTLIAPAVGLAATLLLGAVAWAHPVGVNGVAASGRLPGQADTSVADSDWLFYGRTPKGDRFSPLAQINTGNIGRLKLAWSMETGDHMQPGEDKGGTDAGHEFNFENTPIKVGDRLFVCTGHSWVEAIDARTGKMLWRNNPHANTDPDVYLACRGVAYYEAPAGVKTPCPRRILSPVLDARVMAVNADTGQLCSDFGQGGFISLTQYLGHVPAGFHFVTSPPLVLNGRMILGGWVYDNQREDEPSGAVRAFDPVTGEIIWAWDLGRPPGQQAFKPGPNDVLTRGTPNAWGVYTADPALNTVYLPMGNATPDYYGGNRRPFDEAYASSIVALDITTGQPKWRFQTVHHDLWDFDLPIGPSMVDLPDGHGGMKPALVQTTKRGEFFVLDRRTGQPIVPVVEKPVPAVAPVPGDHVSPTQPYTPGLPSLTPDPLTEKAMWGATPIDQLLCRIEFRQAVYKGQFTPAQLKTTIVYPAFDGVIDWNGASIDPERKLLIALANHIPFVISETRRETVPASKVPAWNGQGDEPKIKGGYAPQYGTPYVGSVHPWLSPVSIPCNPPPWGTLNAIDLVSHKLVWSHPIGTTRDTGPFGTHVNLPLPTGIFNIGGEMVTRGGLIFLGATADDYLRAVDESTGKVVWKARLPAGGQANPMSYSIGGKQYVVIAAGGHGGLGTRTGDFVQAYALP